MLMRSARSATLVVAAELAVTVVTWAALKVLDLCAGSLPILLPAWGACFVLYTEPVQKWLTRRTGGTFGLVLIAVAVWGAMTTSELPSIYPVVIGALTVETAQRDSSNRTALTGLALMFLGTGAAQLAVHQGWISSIVAPVPSDHLAVVLLAVGGVVLVRGVAVARRSDSTRAALAAEQQLRHAELQHAATHDPLTGLLTRRGLEPVLAGAYAEVGGVGVMFLDLDGFKAVNDGHGHAVGDELLAAAAGRFAGALGPDAALARMGGDEFVAVLPGVASRSAASERARAVQAALDEEFVLRTDAGGGVAVRVGVSVGLAWTDGRLGVDALMREADRAMYRDKRLRRGERRHLDLRERVSLGRAELTGR
jgi:diguanylate cyclase (GGDEF)-like protein